MSCTPLGSQVSVCGDRVQKAFGQLDVATPLSGLCRLPYHRPATHRYENLADVYTVLEARETYDKDEFRHESVNDSHPIRSSLHPAPTGTLHPQMYLLITVPRLCAASVLPRR